MSHCLHGLTHFPTSRHCSGVLTDGARTMPADDKIVAIAFEVASRRPPETRQLLRLRPDIPQILDNGPRTQIELPALCLLHSTR